MKQDIDCYRQEIEHLTALWDMFLTINTPLLQNSLSYNYILFILKVQKIISRYMLCKLIVHCSIQIFKIKYSCYVVTQQ